MYPTKSIREKFWLLLKLLFPILIYQFANFSAQFFDTVMTGQYQQVHLAGVSVASSLFSPFFTFLTGIVTGIVPIVSTLLGKGKKDQISNLGPQFIYLGIFLALALTLFSGLFFGPALAFMNLDPQVEEIARGYLFYLALGFLPLLIFSVIRSVIDALGKTHLSMMLMLLIVPFNGFFNYSLIFGKFGFPRMGGPGAGLGTALTYWMVLIVAILLLVYHPQLKDYKLLRLSKIEWTLWKEPLSIGFPTGIAVFTEVAIFAFVGLLMAKFGSAVIASHQAAMSFSNLAYAFPMSISTALTIIVAFEKGRGDQKSARTFMMLGILTSLSIAGATLCLVAFNRPLIASLYGSEQGFISLTASFISYSLLFQFFDAVAAPIQGILRGMKDTRIPFLLCLVGFWGIGLPVALLLDANSNLGPYAYWIGLILGLMSNCLLLVGRLTYLLKKKGIWSMNHINLDQPIFEVLEDQPELLDLLVDLGFHPLKQKAVLHSLGRVTSLRKGAQVAGIPLDKIVLTLQANGYQVKE